MILIFSSTTDVHLGGVEVFNEELKILLDERNIEFYNVPSISKNKIVDYFYRIMGSLFIIIKNYKRIDFILVNYGNFIDVLALPFLKLSFKHIRVIVHVGESWKHLESKLTKNITTLFLKMFVKKVYIISDVQREFLSHKSIEKIHTIINKKFLEKEKLNTSEDKYLLYLGRICEEKGVKDLIAVYSELKKTMNIPYLKLVGAIEDDFKEHLVKIIDLNKVRDHVLILDPVYNIDKKIELIDNALVMIYPSRKDAFPLTIIESVSRGIYTLATSISETKNFIDYNEFLFEPGNRNDLKNKLVNLISNKKALKDKRSFLQKKSLIYAKGNIVNEIFE